MFRIQPRHAIVFALALGCMARSGFGQQGDAADQQVIAIFKAKCAMCHDQQRGEAAGGKVDFLLDLKRLSSDDEGFIDSDDPASSYLGEIIADGEMPKKRMKTVEWGGALTDAEKVTLTAWIRRGGASEKYLNDTKQTARPLVDEQQIYEAMAAHLRDARPRTAKDTRFLSFHNLHNDRRVSAEQLATYRKGAVKLLNSLTRHSELVKVDFDEKNALLSFRLSDLGWTAKDWDHIVEHFPYGIKAQRGLDAAIQSASGTLYPQVRADWFVFATSQPPLYHDLVGIPSTLSSLERKLGIDIDKNIKSRHVARAGFSASGVSRNNRMIERHSLGRNTVSFWISYDFGSSTGSQDIFENPLGPRTVFSKNAFKHDGGEVIYGLPNGFQAYVLYDGAGRRIDTAPTEVVFDNTMASGAIINGISCISCHKKGMQPENTKDMVALDRVRAVSEKNFRGLSAEQREIVSDIYPEPKTMASYLRADRKTFLSAIEAADVDASEEPVRALFDRFVQDVDYTAVAADFGLTEDALSKLMEREGELRQLRKRLLAGGVKRPLYIESFKVIARLTGLGDHIEFKPLKAPYFKPPKASAASTDMNGKESDDSSEAVILTFKDAKVIDVLFKTTKGDFIVEVHRDWAPVGADHFIDLVLRGFYDDIGFFRAVPNFMVQFGISGDPKMTKRYGEETIADDVVKKSNERGFITYAKTGAPNSRSTQLFINFKDNGFLDSQGFAPFGKVKGEGMKIVDSINQKYGEPRGDAQVRIKKQGNKYLKSAFPNLDYLKSATLIGVDGRNIDASKIDFKKYVFREGSLFKRQEAEKEK